MMDRMLLASNFILCCLHILLIIRVNCADMSIDVSNITETKVHANWSTLVIPNKVIEKYQVSAYPVKSFAKMELLNRNEWTFYNTTHNTDLLGLHPGTQYNISAWGVTNEGTTEPATKIVWTEIGDPEEPPPVEILDRNGETLSVVLPIGESDKGPITNYYVVTVEKGNVMLFDPEQLDDYYKSQESGIPFYITANLTTQEANVTFIVGDKKTYYGYYNAPLSEKKQYDVLMGTVSTLNGVTKVSYSPLQSVIDSHFSPEVSQAQVSSTLSVILSAAIGVSGFLLVLSVILYFLLRKHYGKRRPSDEMVLRVHGGSETDENGFIPGLLNISDDADLTEIYEMIREKYWQIPKQNLKVHQTVLGIGQFGEVREAIIQRKGFEVSSIVQLMQAPSVLGDKEKKTLLCELEILSRIGFHINVVEFLGACDERDVLQVAIENHSSSLRGLLLRSRQPAGSRVSSLSEPFLLELASGVALGMAHLADRGIIHKHLSARNVFIADGSVPKIAHFGLGHYNPLGKKIIYTRWTAPEVTNLNTITSKSDIWSFGVLLWEIFTFGATPYVSLPSRDILPRVMQGMRLPQPSGVFDDLFQLLLQCWELDSDERPKFMELATNFQKMILNPKDYLCFQDCSNYQYAKFDPNAEDQ